MGLKMREIGFQRTYIFKIFRGSMPPHPPRKVRLRRTITFSITHEHPLENLSYAPACALKVVHPRNNEKFKVRFRVVNESLVPLLGLNATEKMKLSTIHKENCVNVVEDVNSDLIDKYPDVFNKSLGTLPGKVHLQVDPDSKPVVLPARKIPVSVREKFKEELKRLESIKVIAPVDQPTEWLSQIELRVFIDPKPVDSALKREHYQIPYQGQYQVVDDLFTA